MFNKVIRGNVIIRWNIGSFKVWLFRGLVAVAAGLMVASFIMPWWYCHLYHWDWGEFPPIKIYGYGLRHGLIQYAYYLAADETPFYQTMLAWVYLAASVGLILFSSLLKGRKSRWLLGGIGLIYIVYAITAVIQIAIRTADYGISLQGWTTVEYEGQVINAFASLRFGYYIAHAAGLMCIVLALFRNIMVGKPSFEGNVE